LVVVQASRLHRGPLQAGRLHHNKNRSRTLTAQQQTGRLHRVRVTEHPSAIPRAVVSPVSRTAISTTSQKFRTTDIVCATGKRLPSFDGM
ncbi:MAG: hypothetical protein J0I06_18000, partial [Planctomycetes bacterium]|nr:hypothetical protein [Planctomycetota bacterium]